MTETINGSSLFLEPTADVPRETSPDVDSLAPDESAPFGYMIDPESGERRAKKRPGRQAKTESAPVISAGPSPSIDELRERKSSTSEDRSPDDPPRVPKGKRARTRRTEASIPPFRAGPIAAGMNKLYLRIGKVVRAMDHDIGTAIIECTRKEGDEDTTVGEAWEEIAKTNPRIRAFLLKAISGSAMTSLFMAHAPIFLAILMKDGIRKHIPFAKLVGALLDNDDDGEPSEVSQMMGGMQPEDLHQMVQAAQGMMAEMGMSMPTPAPVRSASHVSRETSQPGSGAP